jgi:SHS2 domain-containing protein
VTGAFQVLEHTADIGLRLTGATLDEIFSAAGEGLAALEGSWFPGEGVEREVEVRGGDVAALLVAWLDELLYLRDAEDVVFGGFAVDEIDEIDGGRLRARIRMAPRGDRILDSAGVKAATYHSLRVGRANGGWVADVYLDV